MSEPLVLPLVLVVDDHPKLLAAMRRALEGGFRIETAVSGEEALARLPGLACDVVVTDLRMKGMDGLELVEAIHRLDGDVPVIVMTAFGNVESAVDAIQRGAFHYVTKPFKMATVRVLLERAVADRRLRQQNRQLRMALQEQRAAPTLIGRSAAMDELRALIRRVADAGNPVLVLGETGVGKELVARALHVESGRRDGPFVAVSCAAMPESQLASELFGHRPGAFPGATDARRGLFAEADGGTLFLDEVADMPLPLQGKLVRALASGEIRPLGGEAARRVDVRCVASTRADLQALVRTRSFREDLFFRLDVVRVRVPPLRDRREDIPALVEAFLEQAQRRRSGATRLAMTEEALRALERHAWPGNVRELENTIARMVATSADGVIDGEAVRKAVVATAPAEGLESCAAAGLSLAALEERYIAVVLDRVGGNRAKAAAILGIDPSTLYRRGR